MSNLIPFKNKPVSNLYIVDDFFVTLASSKEEAIKCVQEENDIECDLSVELIDRDSEVHVIKSGKVEVILWKRKPNEHEELSVMLKISDFIDRDLKRFKVPHVTDILEDRGAVRPKKWGNYEDDQIFWWSSRHAKVC